jgi:hypothetical protein
LTGFKRLLVDCREFSRVPGANGQGPPGLLTQVMEFSGRTWRRIGRCGSRGLGRWRAAQSDIADVEIFLEAIQLQKVQSSSEARASARPRVLPWFNDCSIQLTALWRMSAQRSKRLWGSFSFTPRAFATGCALCHRPVVWGLTGKAEAGRTFRF